MLDDYRLQSAIAACLVLVLMLVSSSPARGEAAARGSQVAEVECHSSTCNLQSAICNPSFASMSFEKYMPNMSSQSNIVRFCVCVMALALFIMMKK
jgi:hypothetical protein